MTKTILWILFFLIVITPVFSEEVVVVKFVLDKYDNAKLSSVYLVDGAETDLLYNTSYTVELLDKNGKSLREVYFNPVFHAFGAPIEFEKITVDSRLRYNENATKAIVKKDGTTLLKIDLKGRFCNNNSICENNENALSCPNDCGPQDMDYYCTQISGDGICDPDCSKNNDSECPAIGNSLIETNKSDESGPSGQVCLPIFGLLILIVGICRL